MNRIFSTLTILLTFFSIRAIAQCETAPLEGYRGTCKIMKVVSADGQFVYTSEGKVLKKWSFSTKKIVSEVEIEGGLIEMIDLSDDGKYLSYWYKTGIAATADISTGKQILPEVPGIIGVIGSLDLAIARQPGAQYGQKLVLVQVSTK
ncbi:MAG: hypothetical protein EOP49_47460, partial [Sphingobacteriales bacterium]